ncbi:MAG: hypothetical protein PHS60_04930 [Zavarzinia sp.]|nr:hypothetical protein [Zavarzinia sp.]
MSLIPLLISIVALALSYVWLHGMPDNPATSLLARPVRAEVVSVDVAQRQQKAGYFTTDLAVTVRYAVDGETVETSVRGFDWIQDLDTAAAFVADQIEDGHMIVRVPASDPRTAFRPDPDLFFMGGGIALLVVGLCLLPVGVVVGVAGARS